MKFNVTVKRSIYGYADKIFLHVEGRKTPYELRKREARELCVLLTECSLEKKNKNLKRSVVVHNQNECGVTRFASPWQNPEMIDTIRVKVKNQPRIQLKVETAGFVAMELREFSPVPLYTPKEAEEYLRDKLLRDV